MPAIKDRETEFQRPKKIITKSKTISYWFFWMPFFKSIMCTTFRKRKTSEPQNYTDVEIQNAEIFMRQNVVSTTNRQEMLENFAITRQTRIKLLEDKSKTASYILKRYPLLMEMIETVILR